MIKSKIDARERALELAVKANQLAQTRTSTIVSEAKDFEKYLIGDAMLPEYANENEHLHTLINMIETQMNAFRKQGNDNLDSLTSFLEKRAMALSGVACKSNKDR